MASDGRDLKPPFQIAWTLRLDQQSFDLPIGLLPREYINGDIYAGKDLRCKIQSGAILYSGSRGKICAVQRTPSVGYKLCTKRPHDRDYPICSEALLQWIAGETLKGAGIRGAVPKVVDLYQFAGETRFTMEYEEGVSAAEWILTSSDPVLSLWQILAQVTLLLAVLEDRIHFDHRDLKADNVWIVQRPVQIQAEIGGESWTVMECPFQAVLLDFGFGCIGDDTGNAVVSLTDGLVPKVDPCPKEGRDLFQFLTSLWSIPDLRCVMPPEIHTEMAELFQTRNGNYLHILEIAAGHPWVQRALNPPGFKHPPLSCHGLFDKIAQKGVCARQFKQV
jgi:serine/threonine protein kinase